MAKQIISRVIMLPDGSVHIAGLNGNTFEGTPQSLSDLLSDPYEFFETKYSEYKKTVGEANSSHYTLETIKGLTLIKIYDDTEIICVFPKLLHVVFKQFREDSKSPINLLDLIEDTELTDEKHFLMKFFCDFNNNSYTKQTIKRKLNIGHALQTEILQETINTAYFEYTITESIHEPDDFLQSPSTILTTADTESDIERKIKTDYMTVAEAAKEFGVAQSTISTWTNPNNPKIAGVVRVNNRCYIPRNAPKPPDGRAGRVMPPRSKSIFKSKTLSYEDIQRYIEEKSKISYSIRRYIRSLEEMTYYTRNSYRETVWNDRPVLIIDINPEYYCKRLGKTNRELIEEGHSPVVPIATEPEYDVHHIGQKVDSPFAIIPHHDHMKHSSALHMGTTKEWTVSSDEDLHGSKFKIDKLNFWLKYLEEYDKSGGYLGINATPVRVQSRKR